MDQDTLSPGTPWSVQEETAWTCCGESSWTRSKHTPSFLYLMTAAEVTQSPGCVELAGSCPEGRTILQVQRHRFRHATRRPSLDVEEGEVDPNISHTLGRLSVMRQRRCPTGAIEALAFPMPPDGTAASMAMPSGGGPAGVRIPS